MDVLTTTPFGQRPVTAGLIKRAQQARADLAKDDAAIVSVNKWEILRALTEARAVFGLNAGALTVLNALLSFHRGEELTGEGLVVFPSNRTLASRAHGMPESTLRRHLGTLVGQGLIARHDSPNGKRYAVRQKGGAVARAFGFDLRPLVSRAAEIFMAADEAKEVAERIKRAREEAMLMKRDCWKLLEYVRAKGMAGPWETLEEALTAAQKRLRRVLSLEQVRGLCDALSEALLRFEGLLTPEPVDKPSEAVVETEELSACDSQNERHIQSSNKNTLESERAEKQEKGISDRPTPRAVPVELVLQACPDVAPYAQEPIRHNHQLVETAHVLHRMMGISADVWQGAMKAMGPEGASVTLACMLQRIGDIKNPGGYLRSLTQKAEAGGFTAWPMVKALLGQGRAVQS